MLTGTIHETDCGWLSVYGDDGLVHGLSVGFRDDERALAWLGQQGISEIDPFAWSDVVEKIAAYLAGESFGLDDIRYHEPEQLTAFQAKVRQIVAAIPYGESRTYGEVAELAGRPRAARAVGTVMSSNHVPLLMPCHRVVPAGGKLGGFTGPGGVDLKRRLLDLENRQGTLANAR